MRVSGLLRTGAALGIFFRLAIAGAQADPVLLTDTISQTLAGHLSMLVDPEGELDVASIRRADEAGRFQSLTGSALSLGFPRGAMWLRFSLRNPSGDAVERWLNFNNALVASVVLYMDHQRGVETVMTSGATVPLERRPLANDRILFPLRIEAGETVVVYLRFSGQMAIAGLLDLWQPAAYAEAEWRVLSINSAAITTAVAVVFLVSLYFWQRTRHVALLAVGMGDALFGAAALMFSGFGADWLPADSSFWPGRITGMMVLLGVFFHIAFAKSFLELRRVSPNKDRAMAILAALSLIAAFAQAFTPELKFLTFQCALLIVGSATVVVALVARQGGRNAGLYLLAWLSLASVLVAALGGALLKVQGAAYIHWLPLPSLLLASLVLAFAMYREFEMARQATERTHQHLRELRRTEQERLTLAVESRTRELRAAKAQAEEAGKARLMFLSTVSHELRTPLHTILGYTQLLRKQDGRREADLKLATIESSGLQLLQLIDEILEYIRGDNRGMVLQPVPLSLTELAGLANDTGQVLAQARRNRFVVELLGDLPEAVEVDERRLLQVLDNLISNGCKYTTDGTITLRIESVASPRAAEQLGRCRLCFSVVDTGIGIPSGQIPRLFEPFCRLVDHEYQPGLGLGLAIAREIADAMNSEIVVESELGQGSNFHFTLDLPVIASAGASRLVSSPQIIGHCGAQRTLLIADDIAENREFLRDVCVEWGFRVLMASDGAEALAICREGGNAPDCVLVDQFMPRVDGWAFLRAVRSEERMRRLPVVLVSAAGPQRPVDMPGECKFDSVLLKPIRQHQLADVLGELLAIDWRVANDRGDIHGMKEPAEMPSHEDLAALREMLRLGRVVAIQRHVRQLAIDRPQLADFAREVGRLAERIDLAALDRLLVEAEMKAGNQFG